MNIKFPKSYLELLGLQNGGYLYYSKYPLDPLEIEAPFSKDYLIIRGISGIRNDSINFDIEKNTALLKEW